MGRYYDSWALTMTHGPTITHRPKKHTKRVPLWGWDVTPLRGPRGDLAVLQCQKNCFCLTSILQMTNIVINTNDEKLIQSSSLMRNGSYGRLGSWSTIYIYNMYINIYISHVFLMLYKPFFVSIGPCIPYVPHDQRPLYLSIH